jgi:hypothetical protein
MKTSLLKELQEVLKHNNIEFDEKNTNEVSYEYASAELVTMIEKKILDMKRQGYSIDSFVETSLVLTTGYCNGSNGSTQQRLVELYNFLAYEIIDEYSPIKCYLEKLLPYAEFILNEYLATFNEKDELVHLLGISIQRVQTAIKFKQKERLKILESCILIVLKLLKSKLRGFYKINHDDILFLPEKWHDKQIMIDFSTKYDDTNFEIVDYTDKEGESSEIDHSDIINIEFD